MDVVLKITAQASQLLKHLKYFCACCLLLSSHAFTAPLTTIKIIQNDWVSQRLNALVTGKLLEKLGYQTEYIQFEVDLQWAALRRGHGHIQVEVWQDSMETPYINYVTKNYISHYGDHQVVSREEWWYPLHVKALCPGLPDWQALKQCAHLFIDEMSNGKGVYINGPWHFDDGALIRGLDLNFEVRQVKDDQALWRILNQSTAKKTPLVMINWTPNWTDVSVPGEFVEFPEYAPECHIDPKWGINKALSHDCGNPKDGWIKKAAWPGLEVYAPCAARLLRNIEFTAQMISDAASWVMKDGLSESQAAEKWLIKYQNESRNWLPSCMQDSNS